MIITGERPDGGIEVCDLCDIFGIDKTDYELIVLIRCLSVDLAALRCSEEGFNSLLDRVAEIIGYDDTPKHTPPNPKDWEGIVEAVRSVRSQPAKELHEELEKKKGELQRANNTVEGLSAFISMIKEILYCTGLEGASGAIERMRIVLIAGEPTC